MAELLLNIKLDQAQVSNELKKLEMTENASLKQNFDREKLSLKITNDKLLLETRINRLLTERLALLNRINATETSRLSKASAQLGLAGNAINMGYTAGAYQRNQDEARRQGLSTGGYIAGEALSAGIIGRSVGRQISSLQSESKKGIDGIYVNVDDPNKPKITVNTKKGFKSNPQLTGLLVQNDLAEKMKYADLTPKELALSKEAEKKSGYFLYRPDPIYGKKTLGDQMTMTKAQIDEYNSSMEPQILHKDIGLVQKYKNARLNKNSALGYSVGDAAKWAGGAAKWAGGGLGLNRISSGYALGLGYSAYRAGSYFAKEAMDINNKSSAIGLSAEEYQKQQLTGDRTGVDMLSTYKQFRESFSGAKGGDYETRTAMARYGIDATKDQSSSKAFDTLITNMSKSTNVVQRMADTVKIFGNTANDATAIMARGLVDFKNKTKDVMSKDTVNTWGAVGQTFKNIYQGGKSSMGDISAKFIDYYAQNAKGNWFQRNILTGGLAGKWFFNKYNESKVDYDIEKDIRRQMNEVDAAKSIPNLPMIRQNMPTSDSLQRLGLFVGNAHRVESKSERHLAAIEKNTAVIKDMNKQMIG